MQDDIVGGVNDKDRIRPNVTLCFLLKQPVVIVGFEMFGNP
jgi:hypothetical protein